MLLEFMSKLIVFGIVIKHRGNTLSRKIVWSKTLDLQFDTLLSMFLCSKRACYLTSFQSTNLKADLSSKLFFSINMC